MVSQVVSSFPIEIQSLPQVLLQQSMCWVIRTDPLKNSQFSLGDSPIPETIYCWFMNNSLKFLFIRQIFHPLKTRIRKQSVCTK